MVLGTARYITLEAAKKMAAAGEAEARQNGWNVAIAIVDASGGLILFHKLDETQPGSIAVAQGKARAAALFKRPSEALEDAIAAGKLPFLTVEAIVPMQGGLPVIVEDKVIGAVGVSGVMSAQDEQVAQAALRGLSVLLSTQGRKLRARSACRAHSTRSVPATFAAACCY
jgi:uncharacterized protein GlcG (DUF336 family)